VNGGPAAARIRPVVPGDEAKVLHFVRELARYERREHEVDLDEGRLREHLFGPQSVIGALLAEIDREPVGFALHFASYSTFATRPCLHLEDLFVLEQWRGRGIGLQLLRALAALAVERGCARLEWTVLDWNEAAIGFYEQQGARVLPDWRVCRLDGQALRDVASAAT
jgi:GNAT superfamily N-acetyltransferase